MHGHGLAPGRRHLGLQGLRILGAEIEDVADLDAAPLHPLVRRHLSLEDGRVVLVVGACVEPGPGLHHGLEVGLVVDLGAEHVEVEEVAVAEHLALAGVGQDDELVAQVAADRPGVRRHRHRLQAEAREGSQVGHEHLVVRLFGAFVIQIEGVVVLHQEFAPAHDPEARPHLVPELPLDVVEHARQLAVALDRGPEDLGDQLLVGGAVEHVAAVTVGDAQHLRAVGIVAARLAPQVGRLDGRHQHLLGAGAVLLLAHDPLDLLEHPQAQRQPGVDAGAGLAHHAGAQHQPVRNDLGLGGGLLERRHEIGGKAHGGPWAVLGWRSGRAGAAEIYRRVPLQSPRLVYGKPAALSMAGGAIYSGLP